MLAQRLRHFPPNVFSEFTALAAKHGAINLGQGFPDFDGPEEIKEAAIRAIRDGINQYAISMGARALREAIAEHSARFYDMPVDPETMVSVTSGATEAIFDTVMGLVDPGDEVLVFEPCFDTYAPAVTMAGGVPRFVQLRPPDAQHSTWWFEPDELAAAFSDRTKLVVLNTPHNPTGKVYSRAELELIASLCERHDAFVLADEVYEHIVYEPARHLRIATLPGMRERTITVSSGGKTFSFTGWKIGWAIAVPKLRDAVHNAHQWVTFASAAPLQAAIAAALRLQDSYFQELARRYRARRDLLSRALEEAGLQPLAVEGTFYAMTDVSASGFTDDYELCRFLTREVGVAAIPSSALQSVPDSKRLLARFAFCKTEAVLEQAAARLRALRERLGAARVNR
ncbi:MAG: aminotransferase class I/II-fold pyridoxal phosphate-dependent enzyme [Myxococcales bacterium]|jgi:N-succinyldiaminopimelate aminotransferase